MADIFNFLILRNLAITFDGWRSVALIDFLLVTGHYLPRGSITIESAALQLIDCSDIDHTAEMYAKKIEDEVISRFKLIENDVTIVCATTDNAANMIATAKELKIRHMGCYSHTLQLAVNDLLDPKKKKQSAPSESDDILAEENIYM